MATTRNKVMWQEGMLMRPHHFQQQQRYNDYLDNQRFRAMNDLSWGFTELTLNNELLAQGKIMIDSASGTLPDALSIMILPCASSSLLRVSSVNPQDKSFMARKRWLSR